MQPADQIPQPVVQPLPLTQALAPSRSMIKLYDDEHKVYGYAFMEDVRATSFSTDSALAGWPVHNVYGHHVGYIDCQKMSPIQVST